MFSSLSSLRGTLAAVVLVLVLTGGSSIAAAESPAEPYACEEDLIEVMFARESTVRLRGGEPVDLTTDALAGVEDVLVRLEWTEWRRISPVSEERLDEFHARGQANIGHALYNMNNIYRLRVPKGLDVWEIGRDLEALPGVYLARPVPRPMRAPVPDDFEYLQGYLDPATDTPSGVSAEFSWTLDGGDGTGVTVCDLEYSWNEDHLDLTKLPNSQIMSDTADPFNDEQHGTAVVGVMVSDDDGVGTTGICHGADLLTCGTFYGSPTPEWNVPGAMTVAIDTLEAGDIIVLEQQWDYTGSGGYVPIEWWLTNIPYPQTANAVYVAIQNAVANGIHVVEAGGNGGISMDNWVWVGDSGAIIVGAGGADIGPDADLQRLAFSSFGWRFNCQGWGENVVTTGYGALYDDDGINYAYTDTFAGTSSASPVVAGAAACCVGFWKGYGWDESLLTPTLLRMALANTGTPQNLSVYGNIGSRPNIRAADSLLVTQEIEWADDSAPPTSNPGSSTNGVAWGDYDGDGDHDLYVSCYFDTNKLFRNDGGGNFTDVTSGPLGETGQSQVSAWADYDNDGDLDLYVGKSYAANKLLRNDGSGVFTDVTAGALADTGVATSLAWADYDNDGKVDLFVKNYNSPNALLHNDGGGAFTNTTPAGMANATMDGGCAWGDYDSDGDQDIYIVQGPGANKLFRNDGSGVFTDVTSGPLGNSDYGIAVAWGDYDNDGDLDLYLVNNGYDNKLFRNDGGGSFLDQTPANLVGFGYDFGCAWGDYDNDGDLDLFMTMGYCCNHLFRNDGGGVFTDRTTGPLSDPYSYSIGTAFADYDEDGDIDLFIGNSGPWDQCHLFKNLIGTNSHWIEVNLVGTVSNRAAIGARVRVVTGRGSQIREVSGGSGMRSQESLTQEFGLGASTLVDSLIVNWPSGNTDVLTNLAADQFLQVTESGTSVAGGDPLAFRLHPNTPNPFSKRTLIRYDLPQSAEVELAIYDLAGRKVRTLLSAAVRSPGPHETSWDGRDDAGNAVASGVYFAKLEAGADVERRRLVLLK
jgi:hypothetical protein